MAPMIFASLLVMVSMTSAGPINSVPVAYVALRSAPENIYNHVQDTRTGEYAFGYAGGPVAREESKTADGVTRGAYSYVDAHGMVQHYRYIADNKGFRVAGTNIPTDAASATPVVLEPQVVVESEAIVTEAKSEESQSRKKRSIGNSEVPVVLEPISAPLAIASVPTATSSQSHVQINSNLKTEIPVEPIAAISAAPVAVPADSVAAKAIEVLPEAVPVAVAASVPVATSRQSRFQIHKSLKAEIPVESVAPIPEAPVAVPAVQAAAKTIEAVPKPIPVAEAASVPVATSNPCHSEIAETNPLDETIFAGPHLVALAACELVQLQEFEEEPPTVPITVVASLPTDKTKIPVATLLARMATIRETTPLVHAIPVASETIHGIPGAAPITVAASLPTAKSSHSQLQDHKSLETKIPEAAVSVGVETVRATAPLVHAIPVASETIHGIPSAAPITIAAAATATSNQRRFQVHDRSNLELNVLHQPLAYGVLKIQPTNAVHSLNSDNLIARSPVGVGLGVVPSPVAAYHGAALLAQA